MRLPRFRQRSVFIASLGLATIFVLGVFLRGWNQGWTESKIRRLIRAEVPQFSDKKHVEAWFDRHGIAHGAAKDTDGGGSGDKTFRELAGLDAEDLREIVFGAIEPPDANVDWLLTGRIYIVFSFNKEGQCVGHWVEPLVYSF